MPRGGYRPGSGRKPGQPTNRTREIALKAAAEGITPLEVMTQNMRFYWGKRRDKKEGIRFRALAMDAAKSAAPYMHPHLNSIDIGGREGNPIELAWRGAADQLTTHLAKLVAGQVGAANNGAAIPEAAGNGADEVPRKANGSSGSGA